VTLFDTLGWRFAFLARGVAFPGLFASRLAARPST